MEILCNQCHSWGGGGWGEGGQVGHALFPSLTLFYVKKCFHVKEVILLCLVPHPQSKFLAMSMGLSVYNVWKKTGET